MSLAVRFVLPSLALVLAAAGVPGRPALADERPPVHVPLKKPTRRDLDRVEALKLYGLGVLHERDNRLVEALKTFEEARRLDPDALDVLRSLIPLYLALDRTDDACRTCEKVLALVPDDFETGYLYARQLRSLDRPADALAVLKKLAGQATLKDALEMQARIWYDLGLLHENAASWPEAEAAYRKVTAVLDHPAPLLEQGNFTKDELTNQAAETYERLGRACLKQNKTKQAVAAFEQAQKYDPLRGPRLSFNLAEVHLSKGQPREALARLDEYLRSQPQGMEGYEMKIKLLRQLDRAADVLPELEAASGHDPHNPALKLLLAREYRKAGKFDQARQVYDRLLTSRPTVEVYRELFGLFKEQGPAGIGQALRMLNEAIEKASGRNEDQPGDAGEATRARAMLAVIREDPELVKALLPILRQRLQGGRMHAETRRLFAALAARADQLEAAEELYRSCLSRPGTPFGPNEHEIYAGLLEVLELAHKSQAIVEVCRQGLELAQATNRVLFHLHLAHALMALNRTDEALEAAGEAVKEAGERDLLRCRRNKAALLSQAGRHKEAIAECQTMLKEYNQPGDVRDIRSALSAAYSAAKEHARAEEQLQLILEADPNDATANNDLGYLWADRNKNLPEAEKLVRKAMELDRQQRGAGTAVGLDAGQDNAAYVDSLGWVLFRKGDLAEARKELERAVGLPGGSDDPVVWDHLGDVCFRQGQRDRARQVWRKAVELYEGQGRRRQDDHYRELKQKLRQVEP
jgi:tetratricopeptide (TPR) repeat protein